MLTSDMEKLHVQDIVELCEAFRDNRTHHRDHLRNLLNDKFKQIILDIILEHAERPEQEVS